MSDDIRRPRFFEGKLLRADDLTALQDTLGNRQARHHRLLHGWGVVTGLIPRLRDGTGTELVISPGMALDGRGRELLLFEERFISANAFVKSGADPSGGISDSWFPVFVHAIDTPEAPTRLASVDIRATSERTLEGVEVVFGRPNEIEGPTDGIEPPLAEPAAAAPDVTPWRILVGYVRFVKGVFVEASASPPESRPPRRAMRAVAGELVSQGEDLVVRLGGPDGGGDGRPILVMDEDGDGPRTRIGVQRDGAIETLLRLDADGDLFILGTLMAEVESTRLTTNELNASPPGRLNLRTASFDEPDRAAITMWDHDDGTNRHSIGFGVQRDSQAPGYEPTGFYEGEGNERTIKKPVQVYLRIDAGDEALTTVSAPHSMRFQVDGDRGLRRQLILDDGSLGTSQEAADLRLGVRPVKPENADNDPAMQDALRVLAVFGRAEDDQAEDADAAGTTLQRTRLSSAGRYLEIHQRDGLHISAPGINDPDNRPVPQVILRGPRCRVGVDWDAPPPVQQPADDPEEDDDDPPENGEPAEEAEEPDDNGNEDLLDPLDGMPQSRIGDYLNSDWRWGEPFFEGRTTTLDLEADTVNVVKGLRVNDAAMFKAPVLVEERLLVQSGGDEVSQEGTLHVLGTTRLTGPRPEDDGAAARPWALLGAESVGAPEAGRSRLAVRADQVQLRLPTPDGEDPGNEPAGSLTIARDPEDADASLLTIAADRIELAGEVIADGLRLTDPLELGDLTLSGDQASIGSARIEDGETALKLKADHVHIVNDRPGVRSKLTVGSVVLSERPGTIASTYREREGGLQERQTFVLKIEGDLAVHVGDDVDAANGNGNFADIVQTFRVGGPLSDHLTHVDKDNLTAPGLRIRDVARAGPDEDGLTLAFDSNGRQTLAGAIAAPVDHTWTPVVVLVDGIYTHGARVLGEDFDVPDGAKLRWFVQPIGQAGPDAEPDANVHFMPFASHILPPGDEPDDVGEDDDPGPIGHTLDCRGLEWNGGIGDAPVSGRARVVGLLYLAPPEP